MITLNENPKYLFYSGSTFSVEWYVDSRGHMEGWDYYKGLPEDEKYRLLHLVKYLADNPFGTRLQATLYNLEDATNKIYAFKPKDHRFFNFMTSGRKIIIVNAYRKHSQKMSRKDLNFLETAVNTKKDYLKRVEEGNYYERLSKSIT